MNELPKLIYHRDAPVSETADIPIFLLSQYARQTVKMVLTGEGSDEMLGGYPKHVYERFVPMYQIFPEFIRSGAIEPLIRALPYRFYRAKTAIANLGLSDKRDRLPRWFGSLTRDEVGELLERSYLKKPNIDDIQFDTDPATSRLRQILYFDQTSWLPDNLLERGDRMTMAASLEARMPFMDHKLAEFISTLPDNCRVHGMTTKWILREAMKPFLPHEIIYRPKIGFRVPVNEWFQHSMKEYLYDHLTGPGSLTTGYYKKSALTKILEEHVSGRQNHEKLLWCLLNLELWHKKYFKS
jgi:asparagine synthase (glutamine-hydrolysing)